MHISTPKMGLNVLNAKNFFSILLILVSVLLILVETSRGSLTPDAHRVYRVAISGALIYISLKPRGISKKKFASILLVSLFFPPALLASLFLARESEPKEVGGVEEQEESPDLLSSSYRANLVICRTVRLMNSIAIYLASELCRHRRVVLVDWNGNAAERLKEVDHRIASPSEICFSYPGALGPSYYFTASEFLSYLTGTDPSLISRVLMGSQASPANLKLSEKDPLLSKLISDDCLKLEDALPKLLGVLIIDASKLNVKLKNAVSLMTLLQCSAYRGRDFLVITPLLSPLTDEKLSQKIKDELRWLISSLSNGGCFITSTEESAGFFEEFDRVLECGPCPKPVHKLGGFHLCSWRGGRGKKLV